jgi:hypothetical protein
MRNMLHRIIKAFEIFMRPMALFADGNIVNGYAIGFSKTVHFF